MLKLLLFCFSQIQKQLSSGYTLIIDEILQSMRSRFESNELEFQWNEKSGSLTSAYLEAECRDISKMWAEDICCMEVILKNLSTSILGEDFCRPLSFDLLGFHLKREQLGAKIEGSRIFWNPKIEGLVTSLLPTTRPQNKK